MAIHKVVGNMSSYTIHKLYDSMFHNKVLQ